MKVAKCPHCGNTDSRLMQDNGEHPLSPDLTLLCVRRLPAERASFDNVSYMKELGLVDENGMADCGMQWEPNQEDNS